MVFLLPHILTPCLPPQKKTKKLAFTHNASPVLTVQSETEVCYAAKQPLLPPAWSRRRGLVKLTSFENGTSWWFFFLLELFRPKRCRLRWHHLEAICWTSHSPPGEAGIFIHTLYTLLNTSHSVGKIRLCCKDMWCVFSFIKAKNRSRFFPWCWTAAILDFAAGRCSGVVKWRGTTVSIGPTV